MYTEFKPEHLQAFKDAGFKFLLSEQMQDWEIEKAGGFPGFGHYLISASNTWPESKRIQAVAIGSAEALSLANNPVAEIYYWVKKPD